MDLLPEYWGARHEEDVARLRRVLALRAMVATGMSQREIAAALGISQPAVSQQLRAASDLSSVHPERLVDAAAPVLRRLAEVEGFGRLAVFGSVARREAVQDSDIDLLVEAPEGTSSFGFIKFKQLLERVVGRQIDLVDYGGLKPRLDDDIRREAVLL
ncbi:MULTISPECIES: nucleotidyltransferase domain-containing protein [unclassified Nocardioides]|uniref:nucleotidyltransferase domain-containing protein n=1 Tax=unclassified Nocardioides TaxID=2615069 RepID=UPI0006FE31B6|nr:MULTISPECIES: nucleotidyltransferase domain-containing protein [unclassified Nocardioides]KRA37857.1 Cro/Cl family transcriptional regulator [Nocardioides sp. Root614]KRA91817.1 Cro/Cl family transcriptional regulator [Nocardioides sp. Root682]